MIGIGIDAVEVDRFREVQGRRPQLAVRLFTEGERAECGRAFDAAPRLAARFAAKEAVMKALGVGLGAFAFHDVEVVKDPSGAPRLVVTGAAAKLASSRGVEAWNVSLSHTRRTAHAVVAAVGKPADGPGAAPAGAPPEDGGG